MRVFLALLIICLIIVFPEGLIAQSKTNSDQKDNGKNKDGSKHFSLNAGYDKIDQELGGTMIVNKNNYNVLIDTLGNILIDLSYSKLRYSGNNILAYDRKKGYMLYNLKGTSLLLDYMEGIIRMDPQNPNYIIVKDKKYGLISENGEVVQPMEYDSIYHTNSTKYYFFKKNAQIGIMDIKGTIIHTASLEKVNKISSDSIMIHKGGKWFIWSATDSTYTPGKFKVPMADVFPCFDCSSCPEYGLNPRTRNHCSSTKMLTFIYSNVKYPSIARAEKKEGTVVVTFTVNIDGTTSDFEIKEKLGYELDEAAIEVCKKLKFERAATFEGEFMPMKYTLPIKFTIGI